MLKTIRGAALILAGLVLAALAALAVSCGPDVADPTAASPTPPPTSTSAPTPIPTTAAPMPEPATTPLPTASTPPTRSTMPSPAPVMASSTPMPAASDAPSPTPTPLTTVPPPTTDAPLLRPLSVVRAFEHLDFRGLTNLTQPAAGDDRLFVTEQSGRVLAFPNDEDAREAEVFLDIQDRVNDGGSEEGLLGLAFDPRYDENGYVYVYYSASGPRRSVISRFAANGARANPGSELVIMEIDQPYRNHNGGQLAFGPDGFLYVGLGDGGAAGDPQGHGRNRATLLGSILRIDVAGSTAETPYTLPANNPFAGDPASRGEIWAYGLRNPWRFSFDRETGGLWAGDVGQNRVEEVDVIEKGGDYGWKTLEGSRCFSPATGCDPAGTVLPVWEYPLDQGNCSVIGGHVYRGERVPSLAGAYVFGDFCSGRIWALRYDGEQVTEHLLLADTSLRIASFGEDREGELYVLSQNEGIYRLHP